MNPSIAIVYSLALAAGISAINIPPGNAVSYGHDTSKVAVPPGQMLSVSQSSGTMKASTIHRSKNGGSVVQIPPGMKVGMSTMSGSGVATPPGLSVSKKDASGPLPPGKSVNGVPTLVREPKPQDNSVTQDDNIAAETTGDKKIEHSQNISTDESDTLGQDITHDHSQKTFVSDTNIYDPNAGAYGLNVAPGLGVPCPDSALPPPVMPMAPAYPLVDNNLPYGPQAPMAPAYEMPPIAPAPYGPVVEVAPAVPPPMPYGPVPDLVPPPVYPVVPPLGQVDAIPYGPPPAPSYGSLAPMIPPAPILDDCEEVAPMAPAPAPYVPVAPMPVPPPYSGNIYDDCEEDIVAPIVPPYGPGVPMPPPYGGEIYDDCEEDIGFNTYEAGMDTFPTPVPNYSPGLSTYPTETPTHSAAEVKYDSNLPKAELDTLPDDYESENASHINLSSSARIVPQSLMLLFAISFILA